MNCPPVAGQRLQVPQGTYSAAPPAWGDPFTAAPAASVPPPSFDPYSGAIGVPNGPSPFSSAPYAGPPPAALPYSYAPPAGGGYAAPPAYGGLAPGAASPYGAPYSAAPVAPSYSYGAPPAPAGLYGEGSPLGWQPGTYGFEQGDGSTVRFRQFFSRLRGEHTILLGDNSADAFEVNRTEIASTFAWPIAGQIETPLLVTPGFAFNWFNGPEGDPTSMPRGPDLPPRAYDAYVDFSWFPRFSPELGAELGFRTGVWTDFDEVSTDSMRFLGRALGVVTLTPQFELLLGAVYLDRLRVKTLPAGGVRWRPSPEWDLYLVFPNPKIRRTMRSFGSTDWWWYVAGEYGGGSWTVQREDIGDRIDYNDLRLLFGLEWQAATQARGHIEVGYAFDREILFGDSGDPARFLPDDAVMFRIGIGY
ncbi:hypothetical protein [Botrimarina hoheduenensis]|uniref:hypothetical protein n=1 Tax=Botrimarina hoheduenensis TaxID=2528000 RepID=UPI0011B8390F|nr:hypothetical protein [Botrimarina hoheduenensis]